MTKMARKLQDRLALASYKTRHGLDNLSFSLVEAHLESTKKRKRVRSNGTTSSDTSSSTSDHPRFFNALESSPITAPQSSNSRKRGRAQSMAPAVMGKSRASWKTAHQLPESSPVYHHQSQFPVSHEANFTFMSTTRTVPDSPLSATCPTKIQPSLSGTPSPNSPRPPPRTPPPTRSRSFRQRKGIAGGEEGADLLLYLATSPSPANVDPKTSRIFAPSTPPSNHTALPSSIMSTPGGANAGAGFMAGFNTPGQQFNFADFVNITPSPAQGAFGSRTPGLPKTPLAAKEARRRLNFDSLAPPGGSPLIEDAGRVKGAGLGMELGGELVS